MDFNEVLEWIENQMGETLPTQQRYVLQGIWQNQIYAQIARERGYDVDYLKNIGADLLKAIGQQLGEPVNKKTLRSVLERRIHQDITATLTTNESYLTEQQTQPDWEDTPMISTNPFNDKGCIQDPDRFFDRKPLLHELLSGLNRGCNYSLVGDTQIGKSSILWRICHHIGSEALNLERDNFIYLDMQTIHDENQFFNALCDRLKIAPPCRGFELERQLRGERYILCLDEIEKMIDRNNFSGNEQTELRGLSDGTTTPFSLVIASRTPLSQLFPDSSERTSPLYNICHPIKVTPFSDRIARDFIEHRLQDTGVTFTEDQINELINRSQGNPARLQEYAAHLYYQLTQE